MMLYCDTVLGDELVFLLWGDGWVGECFGECTICDFLEVILRGLSFTFGLSVIGLVTYTVDACLTWFLF